MANPAKLYHELEGPEDAPLLVMANSLGTDLRMWDEQAPELRLRFRLLRYNHRGHEGSEEPPGPYSIADLGEDILALVDELGVEHFSFVGLSIGGMVGMWLASEVPERVERLALCCTTARMSSKEPWDERAANVRWAGTASIAATVVERWFTPAFREAAPETVQRAEDMVRRTPDEGYAACCEAIRDMDLSGRLGSITAPALVVAGEEDQATPPDHAALIRDSIPDSGMTVVQDAAHLANVERPETVTSLLLDHLDHLDHPDPVTKASP
ncbi:3-oxoadipate enol-lactonase [Rubrobacter aplysinae]|uniref:3-oxoadipate enol-lactonase n=1 Tax=Rubrobacter aplysinae TaxID=909625 RepID=UPI00064BC981|nr:3-oxoadipate enol-lactonase [Rubrobacter aplysinae]